jgi:hypothetical protein
MSSAVEDREKPHDETRDHADGTDADDANEEVRHPTPTCDRPHRPALARGKEVAGKENKRWLMQYPGTGRDLCHEAAGGRDGGRGS